MDIQSIFNAGGTVIKNPNYKKGKNNTQPEYITVSDLDAGIISNGSLVADIAYNAATKGQQSILGRNGELDKYINAGLTPNGWENLDKQLADAQSNWGKAFNAAGQFLISEMTLGSFKGFSDLFDFVSSNILHITEDDYQNPVSETFQEWQEAFKENIAPIYADPTLNIQNGGLKDFGWWVKNLPQVGSTLSLLFPTRAVTSGISMLSKIGNVGSKLGKATGKARRWATMVDKVEDANKLNKFQLAINNPVNIARMNQGARTVAEGLLMRTMENYGEARDVHKETYQMALDKLTKMKPEVYNSWVEANKDMLNDINPNDKDAVAKRIAKKAADRTFTMDFSNVVFDVIQLHGLKNIGIGKGVKKVTGRTINNAQKESLKAAEEFATGVTKEATKKGLVNRIGQNLWDFGKYNAKTILEESTEGIEEAVNYIAQQEGLTYGKALLEGTAKDYRATTGLSSYLTLGIPNIISSWSNRQGDLVEYVKNPELQESAFWGVFGGFVFGAGGNVLNKVQLAAERKAQQELMKENPITGEKIEDKQGFFDLLLSPEEKAAKQAITKRIARINQLSEDLKQIKDGVDIFAKANEAGVKPEFTGDKELQQALARQQVESQFKVDVALDAMNSGTFDLMLDYFKSNEVKKAMVKAGVTTEAEVNEYTKRTVKELEDIRDLYSRHSTHVLNQISALNAAKDYDQTIPLQYAQIIAEENAKRILTIQNLDRQIANTEILAGEQENINKELNNNSLFEGAKEAVQLGALIDMYGRLTAESKELDKQAKIKGHADWRIEAAKRQNKAQKDAIISELKKTVLAGTKTNVAEAAIFNAIRYGYAYYKTEDGKFNLDEEIFKRTDEQILKEASEFFDNTTVSDENIIQVANSMKKDIERVTSADGLANSNSKLLEAYVTLSQLNLQKNIQQSLIASTQDQIMAKVDWLHNSMNEARATIIDQAQDIILKAVQQYDGVNTDNGDNIIDVIFNMYQKDKESARKIAESFMSDTEVDGKITATQFIDALDIFNFTTKTNEGLFEVLSQIVEMAKVQAAQGRVKDNGEESQSSSTSEQAISEAENQGMVNPSAQPFETNVGIAESQTEGVLSSQPQPITQDQRPKHNIKFIINNRGILNAIKKSNSPNSTNAVAYDNGDGTLELDIASLPKNEQLRYASAGLLQGDLDMLDENSKWTIVDNPIIKQKGNGYVLVSKGSIETETYAQALEDNYQTFKDIVKDDESFKTLLDKNPNEAINQVSELLNVDTDTANRILLRYKRETTSTIEGEQATSPVEEREIVNPFDANKEKTDSKTVANNIIKDTREALAQKKERTAEDVDNIIKSIYDKYLALGIDREFIKHQLKQIENEISITKTESPISSTGEVVEPQTPPSKGDSSQEVKLTPTQTQAEIDDIKRGIAQTFGKYIDMKDDTIDFDDAAEKVYSELEGKAGKVGLTPEQIKVEVENQKNVLKDAHEKVQALKTKLAQSGANLAFASKFEEPDTTNFSLLFTKSVEAFMDEYKKIIVMPKVDGKQVVRLEDILRICNNVYATSDNSIAKAMYQVIYNYLQSPIGQARYLTIDLNQGNKVLDNITKTSEEIQEEEDKTLAGFRVNIGAFIESANSSLDSIKNEYFKTLDSIQIGDKLQMIVADNEIIFRKGNVTIGNMPKPKIIGESYVQVNEGWITDVRLDAHGNPISSIKDIIEDIFIGDTKDHENLRALLIKVKTLNEKDDDYSIKFNNLVSQFEANPIIASLISQAKKDVIDKKNKIYVDYETNKVDSDKLLNHLSKLYAYSTLSTNASDKDENIRILKRNLNSWFRNLYNTYDAVYNTKENGETEVLDITEGSLIKITDDTTTDYYSLSLVNGALGENTDARIAIVDRDKTMNISGKPSENIQRFDPNSTFIAVFSRNSTRARLSSSKFSTTDYAKAWGVKLTDLEAFGSGEINSIAIAATQTLFDTFEEFIGAEVFRDINKIEDVIRNIIAIKNDNNRISLFRPIRGSFEIEEINKGGQEKGITIHWTDGNNHRRFRIYHTSAYGAKFGYLDDGTKKYEYLTNTTKDTIAINAAYSFMSFIKDICNVNISSIGIKMDNVPNTTLTGFITQKDGKVVVDIPSKSSNTYHKEFDSYNDFLIKGNLIRVNTKKGENGSNFERRGQNMRGNQNLYVSLPKHTPSTQKSVTNVDYVEKSSDKTTFDAVKNIAATNKTNFGLAIFEQILGKDALDEFKEVANDYGILNDILPTRVLYDSLLNGYFNGNVKGSIAYSSGSKDKYRTYARMSTGTKVNGRIPANENIVIGSRFINLASSMNIANRKQAIRKLIHEQLHVKLQSDEINRIKVLTAIDEIYKEFKKNLDKDLASIDKNNPTYAALTYLKKLTSLYKGERLLEEFMVESLTNKTLFEYLNSIKIENVSDNKKEETLFTKIARAIAKFFGWNIVDDSLYMKELNVLRDLTSSEITDEIIPESINTEEEKEQLKEENEVKDEKENKDTNNIENETGDETGDETEDDEEYFDEVDEDDNEYATESSIEEFEGNIPPVDIDSDGFRRVDNLEAFRNKLPIELRGKFDQLKDAGWLEIKCS